MKVYRWPHVPPVMWLMCDGGAARSRHANSAHAKVKREINRHERRAAKQRLRTGDED